MAPFFLRVKLSLRYIAQQASEWTAAIYAVAGLLSLIVSFEGIFSNDASFWQKLLIAALVLVGIWLMCFIIVLVRVGCRTKKKVLDGQNGKAVYVVYGDIFDATLVNESKRYISFAVNRCFDTEVNDRLVSANTVHGMAFNRLYNSNQYTPASLNSVIQGAIKGIPAFITLTRGEKPEGNLKRYEVGTYANLPIDNNLNYLLLGLSSFDSNLNAQTSKQEYVLAIQRMIESFDMEAQGYPVLVPIIGTGKSRADLKEREALEYMIEAFKMNQTKITSDVYIVVYESAKNRVSIADL